MPKMVNHDFVYPLGHILTADEILARDVMDNGLHFTVAGHRMGKICLG